MAPYSAFAQDAWKSVTDRYLSANTFIVNNPETLKKSTVEANGGATHNTIPITTNNDASSTSNESSGSSGTGSGRTSNSSVQSSFVPDYPDNASS